MTITFFGVGDRVCIRCKGPEGVVAGVRYFNRKYPGEVVQECYVWFDIKTKEYPDGWYVTGLIVPSDFDVDVYRRPYPVIVLPSVPLLDYNLYEPVPIEPLTIWDRIMLWIHDKLTGYKR